MIEAGIAGASMSLWWAAMVPAETPRPIIDKLNKWFDQVTATDETKKFLNGFASDPFIATPEAGAGETARRTRRPGPNTCASASSSRRGKLSRTAHASEVSRAADGRLRGDA